jgi:hypothetical protein
MPTPRLYSAKGRTFFCSLCETRLKSEFRLPSDPAKVVMTDHGPSIEWPMEEERAMKDAKLEVLAGC